MRLDYAGLWNEALGLIRRNRAVVIALAGAMFFLPNLLVGYLAPLEPRAPGISFLEAMIAHVREHWPMILAGGLIEMLGMLTLLRLFLKADGRTVGATIVASLALLPTMFASGFLTNMAVLAGLVLLIVPGIYLLGRLGLVPAAIVAENRRNPIDAIRRSVALTRSRGFAIAWVFVALFVLAAIADMAVSGSLGSVAILLAGRDLGLLIAEAAGAIVWAAASVLQAALATGLYQRLAEATTRPASA
ncbi:MAG TPA: YciC family protein [Allosphingosinicella sp.]|nr:YciC family protein [Allosphingosinicella sp.]